MYLIIDLIARLIKREITSNFLQTSRIERNTHERNRQVTKKDKGLP